jgi:preprotein translocase subunit SecF
MDYTCDGLLWRSCGLHICVADFDSAVEDLCLLLIVMLSGFFSSIAVNSTLLNFLLSNKRANDVTTDERLCE